MNQRVRQRGFSLIEAMVALLIIAVGLLGVAGLQALGLNTTSTSRSRAIASILASNMAAYMNSNPAYWESVAASTTFTIKPGIASPVNPLPTGSTANCVTTQCSAAQMAAWDLTQWSQSDQLGLLPAGEGLVSYNSGTKVWTVSVGWQQKRMALNGGGSLAPAMTYVRLLVTP